MEAASYLDAGYATRVSIEAAGSGWAYVGDIAHVSQPSRLKGIQVDEAHGTPFLSATQVFDQRPRPRKWLSVNRTPQANERFVARRTILLTCSGNVARATISHKEFAGTLISHDLLRIEPRSEDWRGWLYAYLLAPSVKAMLRSAQYGHVIKHLETSHINAAPIIVVSAEDRAAFNVVFDEILSSRERGFALRDEAENLLAETLSLADFTETGQPWYIRPASELSAGRRRLEASFYNPRARRIFEAFRVRGTPVEPLRNLSHRIWWESRFSRVFGPSGAPYMSSDELFSIDLPTSKRVMLEPVERPERFFVNTGWLVLACSGQTYGVNGSVALMTPQHERYFFSHDLIRIAPDIAKIEPGYLAAYLGHPKVGYPLLIRLAYGSSIPHLDPHDVGEVPIARLDPATEATVAGLAREAAELHEKARNLEARVGEAADLIIGEFLDGVETPKLPARFFEFDSSDREESPKDMLEVSPKSMS
jgi:hypothetical protein